MAEALAKAYFSDIFESYSAGTDIGREVNKDAVRIIHENYGIDMSGYFPKTMADIPLPDIVVHMGCAVVCPYAGDIRTEDWKLEDPSGKDDDAFVRTAEMITERLQALSSELRSI
jgi:arsenate reductase